MKWNKYIAAVTSIAHARLANTLGSEGCGSDKSSVPESLYLCTHKLVYKLQAKIQFGTPRVPTVLFLHECPASGQSEFPIIVDLFQNHAFCMHCATLFIAALSRKICCLEH